jgi:hypothetical protein
MSKLFWIIISILFVTSCNKKNISVEFSQIAGDYHWVYSWKSINESYSFDSLDDAYGIRITDKGKLYFFTNGEKTYVNKIVYTYKNEQDSSILIQTSNNKKNYTELILKNGLITTSNIPFEGYTNEFKSIE